LNLLHVIAHTTWGADQQTLLHLYRPLIRSKLDYGCIVYGSARSSYLRMLDPVQNHALRLCIGAFRTSPSSSLSVLANEPPLHLRRQKLSMQYCPLPHRIQHTVQSLIRGLYHHLNANRIKFPLWEFEFTLTCRLLAPEEKTLYGVLP